MDDLPTTIARIAPADLAVLAAVLAGALIGAWRGLARSFGSLLWLALALSIGSLATPALLGWMPNTVPEDPQAARLLTFGALTGLALVLPLLTRLPGVRDPDRESLRTHRGFGVLVGALVAVLAIVLVLPFGGRVAPLAEHLESTRSTEVAAAFADHAPWLYPAAHRAALHTLAGGPPGAEGASP